MYQRLLLASDCRRESLVALREGALIAQSLHASAYLLIVDPETPEVRLAESISFQTCASQGQELLELGLGRLSRLGVSARGEVARGDPAALIIARVRQLRIDLVVLGHRRQNFIDRWWSGPSGGYLADQLGCSLLVARDTITDAEFERRMQAGSPFTGL